MNSAEKITGDKIFKLINQLKKEKSILRLNILGTGYEGLSIVLGIKMINESPCLILDFPAGARESILNSQGKKTIIEFNDKDRILYTLRSIVERVSEDDICILVPNVVYRLQRRQYFRIISPIGTKVIINEGYKSYEFNMIDISEGGTLISQPAAFHDANLFFKGAQKPLLIIFYEGNAKRTIRVNKAEIKRIEKIPETSCINYGVQFIDCDKKEENTIRNFVFSRQRMLLQKKRFPDGDSLPDIR
jgi:c-di-GMP-binding flagellar brake protein YcgR